MFRWIRRHLRQEHIKMVKQNALAYAYLASFARIAQEGSGALSSGEDSLFAMNEAIAKKHLEILHDSNVLPPLIMNDAVEANKWARRVYDSILTGRHAFVIQFGADRGSQVAFDQEFVPADGWKVYIGNFTLTSAV